MRFREFRLGISQLRVRARVRVLVRVRVKDLLYESNNHHVAMN